MQNTLSELDGYVSFAASAHTVIAEHASAAEQMAECAGLWRARAEEVDCTHELQDLDALASELDEANQLANNWEAMAEECEKEHKEFKIESDGRTRSFEFDIQAA